MTRRPGLVFQSDAEAAEFEERAAIREFDGGMARAAAERLAWLDLANARAAEAPADLRKAS